MVGLIKYTMVVGMLTLSSLSMAQVLVTDTQKYTANSCEKTQSGEGCSKYEIEFPQFSGKPWLNQYIERDIRATVSDDVTNNAMPWQQFLDHYANISTEISDGDVVGQDFWLQVTAVGIQDNWTALVFSTHEYFTGAAHGMPGRSFRVLDTAKEQAVLLKDIVLPTPDALKALEKVQYQAAKQYYIDYADMDAAEAEAVLTGQRFSFHLSEDWRPVQGGLAFGYGAYEIGPYVLGMPEIFVKKADLQKIIRPEVLKRLDAWPVAYQAPDKN
jgi:hypothetical protein